MLFKTTIIISLFSSQIAASNLQAEEKELPKGLTVERSINNPQDYNFANDNNIQPDKSDFKVMNYVLLSNEEGDRWVTVTLKNKATGNRIFDKNQIMALFANGKRATPVKRSIRFEGKESQTFAINFGRSHFPILEVYTRN